MYVHYFIISVAVLSIKTAGIYLRPFILLITPPAGKKTSAIHSLTLSQHNMMMINDDDEYGNDS